MDASDRADTNEGSHVDPAPVSLPSAGVASSQASQGAPAGSSPSEPPAGVPHEPLVVPDPEPEELTPNQQAFLWALAQTLGNVSAAAKLCKIDRRSHHRWVASSRLYAQAVADVDEEAADEVDAEIRRRAIEGVDEPQFYQGEVCGHVRKYSDVLLIFRAKALRPEKYRERFEHTGAGGKPLVPDKVDVNVKFDLSILNDDELDQYTALVSKLASRGEAGTLQGKN